MTLTFKNKHQIIFTLIVFSSCLVPLSNCEAYKPTKIVLRAFKIKSDRTGEKCTLQGVVKIRVYMFLLN